MKLQLIKKKKKKEKKRKEKPVDGKIAYNIEQSSAESDLMPVDGKIA